MFAKTIRSAYPAARTLLSRGKSTVPQHVSLTSAQKTQVVVVSSVWLAFLGAAGMVSNQTTNNIASAAPLAWSGSW